MGGNDAESSDSERSYLLIAINIFIVGILELNIPEKSDLCALNTSMEKCFMVIH